MDMKVIWEAVKEPLREMVLALIPVVLAWLNTIPAQWAVALYLILRMIDSYLHELGKSENNATLTTGITRF